jgi:hypothetical protein
MSRIDVPTHLTTQDKFLVGLDFAQVLLLLLAAGAAWLGWVALPLPFAGRTALALAVLAVGAILALLRPAGRGLDDWTCILAGFAGRPRRRRYRRGARA